ncbi:RDD family protein [Arthrobacter sp. MSA 4-2]|uniref:RDD family protein n=1 Tax=Arthrobacter sp. MSA 4-2 TaxID=2794349 RepID=UPI0018E78D74|nr:RDD family protein [Arthrobacter sp. MSA 4-2]MBJ2122163.1 RDD family protein [Arthrobacter sp. MSA 4-2]
MVNRNDVGSWLNGPPPSGAQDWPGQRLGRPKSGPGSIARVGPRVVALLIDWALCTLISQAFFGWDAFATTYLFLLEQILFVGFFGYSIGHRVLSMQVQTLDGRPAGFLTAAIRSVLICLVIPALIFDPDQRGLHDRARGTVLVRI